MKTKRLVMLSLFAALICVLTMFPKVPVGMGYIHLGDSVIVFAAFFLGPVYGGTAAGIGSALADVFSGFAAYAPATLVIKFLTAAVAGLLFKKLKSSSVSSYIVSAVAGEIVMVLGYFLYELALYGEGAVVGLAGNSVQAAAGVIIGTIFSATLKKQAYKILK